MAESEAYVRVHNGVVAEKQKVANFGSSHRLLGGVLICSVAAAGKSLLQDSITGPASNPSQKDVASHPFHPFAGSNDWGLNKAKLPESVFGRVLS